MTEQQKALQEFLERLEKAEAEGTGVVYFTKSEARALHEIARYWQAGESVGFLAGKLAGITGYFAAGLVAWAAFKAGFFDWIRAGLGQ